MATDAELTHDEILAVLAWIMDRYCGTGVVEIDAADIDNKKVLEIHRTAPGFSVILKGQSKG